MGILEILERASDDDLARFGASDNEMLEIDVAESDISLAVAMPPPVPVVAFLQNQYGSPESVKTAERVREMSISVHTRFVTLCLFAGCLTGKRLESLLGDDVWLIHWQDASREIGTHASARFAADPEHVANVLGEYKPRIVLAFGKIAAEALTAHQSMRAAKGCRPDSLLEAGISPDPEIWHTDFELITGPHPVARHAGAGDELRAMIARYRSALATVGGG